MTRKKTAFYEVKIFFSNKSLSLKIRRRILTCCIEPVFKLAIWVFGASPIFFYQMTFDGWCGDYCTSRLYLPGNFLLAILGRKKQLSSDFKKISRTQTNDNHAFKQVYQPLWQPYHQASVPATVLNHVKTMPSSKCESPCATVAPTYRNYRLTVSSGCLKSVLCLATPIFTWRSCSLYMAADSQL